jgi:sugar phosphate isomerase/epimerase
MVPWSTIFAQYAKANYTGPLSLHTEYPHGDDLPNIQQDLNYLKGQIDAAYGG